MRRIVLVCLAVLLALGALAIGYAKWSDTLDIQGTVETGELDWEFVANSFNQKDIGLDWTGDLQVSPVLTQLDKDVGSTSGVLSDTDNDGDYDLLTLTIYNAYPSYANDISFWVHCNGSVPLIIEQVIINGDAVINHTPSPVILLDLNGDGANDVEILWGDNFGTQLHYCESVEISFLIHILQPIPENSTLPFNISLDAVQWNESMHPHP
jgi:hypothetical protein